MQKVHKVAYPDQEIVCYIRPCNKHLFSVWIKQMRYDCLSVSSSVCAKLS